MQTCIAQLVRKDHIEVGRSIKLGLFDSRKQWMAGEITFADGPYGESSTMVQVLKAKVSPLPSLVPSIERSLRLGGSTGMATFLLEINEDGGT